MTPEPRRAVILLTGAGGQVGGRLRAALAPLGELVALTREELDLADLAAVRQRVREIRPRVVVNAAAYTAVDRAETEEELAFRVNAHAPAVLAEETRRLGGLLVHFSTDYVFDGTKSSPYTEADPPLPLNVYGRSKRAGEEAVAAVGGAYLVLRTSWIYDVHGRNFLRTMLRLARERDELRVVDDQVGSPTWARALAGATAELLADCLDGAGRAWPAERSGLYHLSAAGQTSWHGFARAILQADPRREEQRCRALLPIPTSEYPTPAARPAYSVLANDLLEKTFGLELPPWQEQLHRAMEEERRAGERPLPHP